jgi:hypothetical protein
VEENKNPGFWSEDFTRERLNQEKEQGCDYSLEKSLLFCNFLVPYAFSVLDGPAGFARPEKGVITRSDMIIADFQWLA